MRVLGSVEANSEQLPIVLNDRAGVVVVRGAAGSGKTTTAILRLKQLCAVRVARKHRLSLNENVRVLVLTFNRSLRGYIQRLVDDQIEFPGEIDLHVDTFAGWACGLTGHPNIWDGSFSNSDVLFGSNLSVKFIDSEVEYALGRFRASEIGDYASREREGRGISPRVDRKKFLTEAIVPFMEFKKKKNLFDWNDLAESAASVGAASPRKYDIVIVDETQDFSANQMRAVAAHIGPETSTTFVLDSAQRIYPRYFTWREVGFDASKFVINQKLQTNQRNTREIAAFARPLVEGLVLDENGLLPDINSAKRNGPLPIVFSGIFSEQAARIVQFISGIDTTRESVGILHPLGRGWFDHLRSKLAAAQIDFVELQQKKSWPTSNVNVALSTLHSAKGLEFDHVVICGVTSQTFGGAPDADDDTDSQARRRLLAMGICRAKESVMLCVDNSRAPEVLDRFDKRTYISEPR